MSRTVVTRLEVVELDDHDTLEQPTEKQIFVGEVEMEKGFYDTDKVEILNNTAFQKHYDYWENLKKNCDHTDTYEIDEGEYVCEDCDEIVTDDHDTDWDAVAEDMRMQEAGEI